MKYSELPEELKFRIEGKVTEHEDDSISVDGHVRWHSIGLTSIPIKFRHVTGNFWCFENKLTSLENAPDWVGTDFWCHRNRLTSLDGAPAYIGKLFQCRENRLTSLDGLGEVRGPIYCGANLVPEEQLIADYRRKRAKKDLVGESKDLVAKILHEAPIVADFDSKGNPKEYKELPGEDLGKYDADALIRFSAKADPEYKKKLRAEIKKRTSGSIAYRDLPKVLKSWIIGTVTEHEDGSISVDGNVAWDALTTGQGLTEIPIKFRRVSGDFECGENRIYSLRNAPDFVGRDFYCFNNRLVSLDDLGEVQGEIFCSGNPVSEEELLADYRRNRARKELVGESLAVERILT